MTTTSGEQAAAGRTGHTGMQRLLRAGVLVALFCAIAFVWPRPETISPAGWRLFALFSATVLGLILQPVPGGALVLLSITLASLFGGLTIQEALTGFGEPTVWLVMAAFFISRALLNTGLARRIALFFVRTFGKSSLGVSYALAFSDLALAPIIPSNGARSGGVVLPIVRSIAELYGSEPGATARKLGSFLMSSVYQAICITAAMFLTGQASNPLAARIAQDQTGFQMTFLGWALAGCVPGMVSLLVVPYVVYRLNKPEVEHTPQAAAFAADQLRQMGRMSRGEKIVSAVFFGVCLLWITAPWHGLDLAISALLGACTLLMSGVITWEDVKNERAAWDIFIWYGGLLRLGRALNEAGVTTEFANTVGRWFGGTGWVWLLVAALLIYFFAHYGFASITAHILAMFTPFLLLLTTAGAPVGLVAYGFACFTNLAAGLTNYGTTPSPMFFAHDYVDLKTWWKIGLVCGLVNLAIWSTIGFGWWKLIGLW